MSQNPPVNALYWESLKFGMFIHFGMSTFTGNEYGEVPAAAGVYKPTDLDVGQWIDVAKAAGMRYAVLTAKHCYGHCLWPSVHTDYTVRESGDGRDVVRHFVDASREEGIEPGLYYLLGSDWRNNPKMPPEEYEEFCKRQLTELLTGYGPLLELWLDIPWELGPDTPGALQRIYDHCKAIQPECLILLNHSHWDGSAPRKFKPKYFFEPCGDEEFVLQPTDLINGERVGPPPMGHSPWIDYGGKLKYVPMEVCETIGENWFWVEGDELRSIEHLKRIYDESVGRGANLLLDVPPDKSGQIPQATVDRLLELAAICHPERT